MAEKIKNIKDLQNIRDKTRAEIELRSGIKEMQITVHMGTCGIAAGARDILAEIAKELEQARIETVTLRQSGCIGLCSQEPMLTLKDKKGDEFRYGLLDATKVREIVREHVIGGNPVHDYIIKQ